QKGLQLQDNENIDEYTAKLALTDKFPNTNFTNIPFSEVHSPKRKFPELEILLKSPISQYDSEIWTFGILGFKKLGIYTLEFVKFDIQKNGYFMQFKELRN
ncbi:16652_t:CDS:2, partial [Funneliformis mosseae]